MAFINLISKNGAQSTTVLSTKFWKFTIDKRPDATIQTLGRYFIIDKRVIGIWALLLKQII